ncbi:MAG: 4-hydroxybenzoate octaprenyltransferase [Cyanobium sp. NAT70]|nr:4-hydroxybenzoate octaprenyltransferase [Cyanobium sp. NAT70]
MVLQTNIEVNRRRPFAGLLPWIELLRWNKPTGRLILLIPAGWALWLSPSAPPTPLLIVQILVGGLAVSGAGCIANDLWDQRIDRRVERTKLRPLARGAIRANQALALLVAMLALSLIVVLSLPPASLRICLSLAFAALPPILLYPSAKRWFPFPQAILAICWGFAVLIPWAAAEASISSSWALMGCWMAAMVWTFGFDTVYAMADRRDDASLGLRSSALTLGPATVRTVRICYGITIVLMAVAALAAEIGPLFWPCWFATGLLMQSSCASLSHSNNTMAVFGRHFSQQVQLGSLLLLGLILGHFF